MRTTSLPLNGELSFFDGCSPFVGPIHCWARGLPLFVALTNAAYRSPRRGSTANAVTSSNFESYSARAFLLPISW